MDTLAALGGACSLAVAGAFAWAGAAKIRQPGSMYESLEGLGLGGMKAAPFLARTMPWAELGLAAALLAAPGPWGRATAWAAAGAGIVLLIVIVRARSASDDATCSCFGSRTAVGPRTIVRNAVLVAVAVAAAALRPESLWRPETIGPAALGATLIAIGIAFGYTAAPDAGAGRAAVTVARARRAAQLVVHDGSASRSLGDLLSGQAGIVLFLDGGPESTSAAASARRAAAESPGIRVLEVQSAGSKPTARLLDPAGMAASLAGVSYFPTALLFGTDGIAATEPADGAGTPAIESLVNAVVDAAATAATAGSTSGGEG